ncbi:MAG TPA: C1 family peptidase [Thermoanaerobaculia bacterium]|jgi:hypothetical protein
MSKSIFGEVQVGNTTFAANVTPDAFDERDLEYRPRLQVLDETFDARTGRHVLTQEGNSCTGHAVAAMVNAILGQKAKQKAAGTGAERVSPYMLYYLARRYDEFAGEEDAGSSVRGVLKGWWRHGVCREDEWANPHDYLDLDDEQLVASCRRRPLGAFYRVNARRLDDMQSAITELHGIVASALIHDGWRNPVPETWPGGDRPRFVIRRTAASQPIGGHAFAIVGYDEVGFLVQNSWGTSWGANGFATLPYEDWLESAYDAWVARPGVPQTPFERMERTVAGGTLTVAKAPNFTELRKYVLNLGNEGRLSTNGKLTSSPAQLRGIIQEMERRHQQWGRRDVVIYVHGGLVSEEGGIRIADRQFQWWLDNQVFPIFIAWQSGLSETLIDFFADKTRAVPAAAGFDFSEAMDKLAEKLARNVGAFAWKEMKENARAACAPLLNGLPAADAQWFAKPGASLLAQLLADSQARTGNRLRVHLVGHSTGAILHAAFFDALRRVGIGAVETLAYLAGAIRVDEFDRDVRPHLGNGGIRKFTNFTMNDQRELDDVCKAGPVTVYRKSLLYFVSRGFERPKKNEEPLVGMQRFFAGKVVDAQIAAASIVSPDLQGRCNATSHGGFDEDEQTMNEVMRRIRPGVAIRPFGDAPAVQPAAAAVALTTKGRAKAVVPSSVVVGGAVAAPEGVVQSGKEERRSRKRGKELPKGPKSAQRDKHR